MLQWIVAGNCIGIAATKMMHWSKFSNLRGEAIAVAAPGGVELNEEAVHGAHHRIKVALV